MNITRLFLLLYVQWSCKSVTNCTSILHAKCGQWWFTLFRAIKVRLSQCSDHRKEHSDMVPFWWKNGFCSEPQFLWLSGTGDILPLGSEQLWRLSLGPIFCHVLSSRYWCLSNDAMSSHCREEYKPPGKIHHYSTGMIL